MSIIDKYKVRSIDNEQCKEWLLYKHYAKRIPLITYCFGLFNSANILQGVCTFAPPPISMNNGEFVFKEYRIDTFELNRLVVNEGLEKNITSFFVSNCIRLMPTNCCLVSYADKDQNHHGYIYQATNWIYTGMVKSHAGEFIVNGKKVHPRTMSKRDKIETAERLPAKTKFRYFFFKGNKYQKAKMFKEFLFPIIKKYPKGLNVRYNSDYKPTVQAQLF